MAIVFQRGRNTPRETLYFKFLLYGHSGSGKTWMAASGPKSLVLLTERNGEQSVRLSNPDAPYAVASSMDDVRDVLRLAQSGSLGTAEEPVETLVIDGLTEIQRLMKDEMIRERADGEFTIAMWGELTEKMRRLLRLLRDLPYHVVCTALAESEMEGETRHVFPAFQGRKLFDEVMQYFNAVGYVHKLSPEKPEGQIRHVAMFDGPSRFAAKNSHPLRGTRAGPVSLWIEEMKSAEPVVQEASGAKTEPVAATASAEVASAEGSTGPATTGQVAGDAPAPGKRTLRRKNAAAQADAGPPG